MTKKEAHQPTKSTISQAQAYHRHSLMVIAVAIALFFTVNIFAQTVLKGIRFDFTANKLYTLSEPAQKIIQNIDETIHIDFFYSKEIGKKIPTLGLYADRIKNLLLDLENLSYGKLKVSFINPIPFSDTEDQAVASGIQAIPLNTSGETVYFGISGRNSIDQKQVISYLQPDREAFLEYDIVKLIYQLNQIEKPYLTIVTSLPIEGTPPNPMMGIPASAGWKIYEQLQSFYHVTLVSSEAEKLPEKIDSLFLLHPKNMNERLLYHIDQYVLSGGPILACLDPLSEVETSMMGYNPGQGAIETKAFSSNLDPLLAQWGISYNTNDIVGDIKLAERVNAGEGRDVKPVSYIPWLNITNDYFEKNNPVIASLSNMRMISVGHFMHDEKNKNIRVTPLISSSPEAMRVSTKDIVQQPSPISLLSNYQPEKRFDMAVQISGRFSSAFSKNIADQKKTHLSVSEKPSHIILVGDVDFLYDVFWISTQEFFGTNLSVPTSSNGDFILNALESLSSGQTLASLRSRGQAFKPFTYIKDMQIKAEAIYLQKEQELQDELTITKQQLDKLEQFQTGNTTSLNKEQEEAIHAFRQKMIAIRKDLRDVQKNLRKDIDVLIEWLQFINIFSIPILLAVFAVIMGYIRKKRRASLIHTT